MSIVESPRESCAVQAAQLLEVYAMPGCPGWRRATTLVTMVHAVGISGVDVRVVDMSRPGIVPPDCVVASPTWVLNGCRLALGNPDPDWMLAHLDALTTERSESIGGSPGA